jgi:precorrin-6A synthase
VQERGGRILRHILIIGIGAGDPDHMTVQAIEALNRTDVIFIPDKGAEKAGLRRQRQEICARFIKGRTPCFVAYETPTREKDPADYKSAVADWHAAIEAIHERLFTEKLGEAQTGAFLVWGDPALYDSTLRIVANIHARGALAFDYDIIPGVSSVQALAAKHKIALNRIGESVLITTGRKLAENVPDGAGSVVVLIDGETAFASIEADDLEIYWGANIGTPQEALASGPLAAVKDEIKAARARVRDAAGWVMDAYLLRRKDPA